MTKRGIAVLAGVALLAANLGECGSSPPNPAAGVDHNPADGGNGNQDEAASSSDEAGMTDAMAGGPDDATSAGDGPISSPAPGVRWLGRADTSASTAGALGRFAWSASGFAASVSGSKISVKLETEGATTSAFFTPVIDGAVGTRFQVMAGSAQTVVLAMGLSAGAHTVELYRETEGEFGDDILFGFPDGTLGPPPAQGDRLLEIVGDSISAGYGNLGSETHPPYDNTCTFSLDTESAYASYGALLGRTLGAEVSILARSGWGMYRDLNGDTSNVVPSVYANTLGVEPTPAWSFARKADAVLVNLGANDSAMGDPGQPYEDAYLAFLKTVREHYPSAWIFLTIGPMTSDPLLSAMRTHLTNVVSTMSDAKIMRIDIPPQNTASTGCDYHPNVAEDMTMAAALAPTMQQMLGW